jgi:hypothetical protein|tara:strand:+ start:3168 stop:3566 length:399 start_codon:yes stop_codon:yes gene_type:complete
MHWKYAGKPDLNQFGFVYIITNKKTGKAYIGCKQYHNYKKYKGKTKKTESNWKLYMGSSKHLLEDIKKLGKSSFTFKIIAEFKNKRSLRYYECCYQMKYNVLTSLLEDTDEPAFYNNYVGGKFYRPVQCHDV